LQPAAPSNITPASANNTAARRSPVVRILERIKTKARNSGSFLYAAIANTGRADTKMLRRRSHHRANPPEVGFPPPPPRVICVADDISECRALTAQLTLRHRSSHFAIKLFRYRTSKCNRPGPNNVMPACVRVPGWL
jgi:hypothetical protein